MLLINSNCKEHPHLQYWNSVEIDFPPGAYFVPFSPVNLLVNLGNIRCSHLASRFAQLVSSYIESYIFQSIDI